MTTREEAKRLIDSLPEQFTWEDLMHEIYLQDAIDRGFADSEANRVTNSSEIKAKYGLLKM